MKVHPSSQLLEKTTVGCIFLGMFWAGISLLLQLVAVGLGNYSINTASDGQEHILCYTYVHDCFGIKYATVPWEDGLDLPSPVLAAE